jgi:hypothetical protein
MYVEHDLFITGSGSSALNGGTVPVKRHIKTSTVGFGGTSLVKMIGSNSNLESTVTWGGVPNLQIYKGTWSRITVTGDVKVNGDLTVTRINQINGGNIRVLDDIVTTDTKVTGTATIKLYREGSWNTHTINAGGQSGELPNLHIVSGIPSHYATDASSAGWLGVQSFTMDSGAHYTAPSTTMYVSGNFDVDGGATFNHNNGLVVFDNGGSKTIDTDSSMSNTLYDMKVALSSWSTRTVSGSVYVDNDLTIAGSGSSKLNGGTIDVTGNVVTTTYIGGDATIHMNGAHTINAGSQSGGLPNLLVTGGTVDASSATVLRVRDLTISGGTFDAPGGTLRVYGNFDVDSGATFNHNSGKTKFENGGSKTINTDSSACNTLYDMEVALSSWSTRTVSGTVYVDNDLTIGGSSSSKLNGGTIDVGGDVVTTTYIGGDATIQMNGAHTINAGGQSGGLTDLEVTGGTVDASGATVLRVRDLTISGGSTFTAPDSTGRLEISRHFTVSGGTFTHNSGTVKFIGGSGTVSIGSTHLNHVTFSLSSWATITINSEIYCEGDLTIQGSGSSKVNGGTVAVEGDVTTTNTGFSGSGTVKFVGSGDQTLGASSGTGQLPHVEIAKSGGTLTMQDTIEVVGDWTYTSGTVDAGTSTVKFQGGSKTVDANGMSFYDVIVNLGSWAGLTVASDWDIDGDFTMSSSSSAKLIMEHGGADIIVAGNVNLNSGGLRVDCNGESSADDLITYGGTLTGTFSSVSLYDNAGGLSLGYGDGSDDAISLVAP